MTDYMNHERAYAQRVKDAAGPGLGDAIIQGLNYGESELQEKRDVVQQLAANAGPIESYVKDHAPRVFGQKVVATRKNSDGNMVAFQLENGTVLDYYQMFIANDHQGLTGMRVQGNREGEPVIISQPDGDPSNNLTNLPGF